MKSLLLHGNNKNCKKFYSTDPWKDLYEKILHLGILINTITTTINLKEIADQDERRVVFVPKTCTIQTDRGGIQSAATVFSVSFSVFVWKAQCRIYHDCKSLIIYPQAQRCSNCLKGVKTH